MKEQKDVKGVLEALYAAAAGGELDEAIESMMLSRKTITFERKSGP